MALSLDNLHSWAASVARGGRGLYVRWPNTREPAQLLELYEYESCPFCRKVREVLTELDLDYISKPTPRGATVHRARVRELGGRDMYPFLVDPNSGRSMYESEDIIDYLFDAYGPGRPAFSGWLSPLTTVTSAVASAVRPLGGRATAAGASRQQPPELLELWNIEASPYCRKVREALCSLGLDYRVHNVGKNSRHRSALVELGGRMMVPYLVDPNSDTALYESDDIVAYLHRTYA